MSKNEPAKLVRRSSYPVVYSPRSSAMMSAMPSMLDMVSWIAIGYGALVALLAVFSAWRWRARPPWLESMVWMLELLHGVRAVGGLGALLAGDRPSSMTTYVGYLMTSVAMLPIALQAVDDDESVWSVWVIAVAAVAVSVVGWRLMVTQ